MKRKLPIGIQTFRTIREDGYYYVDKTAHVWKLVSEGTHYFLSRPRRFGKSLLVDTLKELFEGNEPLFRGLAIHAHWPWSDRHPVVRLSFGSGDFTRAGNLHEETMAQLDRLGTRAGVGVRYDTAPARFSHLLEMLHDHTGRRVVVLVDEYDKPILDVLDTPETARTNRDYLRGLYGAIKDSDAHVRFALLTGVSRFSKVNLFSVLNNLTDLTLDPGCSTICGYTEADLDAVFAPELQGLDREAVRDWYNGYSWRGDERVYNPFDVLLLLRTREFAAYWFETGSPAFLIDTMVSRGMTSPDLDGLLADRELLSTFDVGDMAPEALLFQTGYLTIRGVEDHGGERLYRLGYPNREVRQSLNRSLLRALAPAPALRAVPAYRTRRLLEANDFAGLEAAFRALFSAIPYEWHSRNDIARYEGYYASVFYSHLAAAGLDVTVEDSSSRGRADLVVRCAAQVHLFEFKVVEMAPSGTALAQLRQRGDADKYLHLGVPIHLIGVEFSRDARNVTAFDVRRIAASSADRQTP